jgi:hypothetical protein
VKFAQDTLGNARLKTPLRVLINGDPARMSIVWFAASAGSAQVVESVALRKK